MSDPSGSRPRWSLLPQDPGGARSLADAVSSLSPLSPSPLLGQLLLNRGLSTPAAAAAFLEPRLEELADPFLARGMKEAVARILLALERGERIAVHGDYDADGITAVALLVLFFRALGVEVLPVLPRRSADGYGVSAARLRLLAGEGITLVITVDCGITAAEAAEEARALGVDLVITDHHEPPARLPAAAAVIDPLLPGCRYPDKTLAGVGLAFLLAAGVRQGMREAGRFRERPQPDLRPLLDLVAVGTLADMVPLAGANRILARAGLARMAREARPGLAALLGGTADRPARADSASVAFRIAPRLNAPGRMGDPGPALSLLLADDPAEARALAARLEEENLQRQRAEEVIFRSALAQAEQYPAAPALVLFSPDWHPGVVGIVASRLLERFHRPVVLLTEENGAVKGSGRSTPAFHLVRGLSACGDLLLSFGGHHHAAGLTLGRENIPAFRERLERTVAETVPAGGPGRTLALDAPVPLSSLSLEVAASLEALAPFGTGNPEPLLLIPVVQARSVRAVGTGHLSFHAFSGGSSVSAIAFRQGDDRALLDGPVDLAATPEIDQWQGRRRLRLLVRAIRPAV